MAGRAGNGLIMVVRGDGWALYWPCDMWDALDADEQLRVKMRQTALLSGDSGEAHGRNRKN